MRNQPWPSATFAELLERILEETGMSQVDLAGMIPIDPSQITRWKSGSARPGFDKIQALGAGIRERYPGLRLGEPELLAAAGYTPLRPEPAPELPDRFSETEISYPSGVAGDRFFEHIWRYDGPGASVREKKIAIRAVVTDRELAMEAAGEQDSKHA
ncbi:helix-turn-helix domain-containing protein [Spirillospora sp. CA-294931]|uniref:helix-turn-helix domain-containing protein n=1 Tax=Spirillospora sp. CA-294931 TaxID=3240042 RepID=UPI003D8D9511